MKIIETTPCSNDIYEAVFQALGAAVLVLGENGQCLIANEFALNLLGEFDSDLYGFCSTASFYLPDKITSRLTENLLLSLALQGEYVQDETLFVRSANLPEGGSFLLNITALNLRTITIKHDNGLDNR